MALSVCMPEANKHQYKHRESYKESECEKELERERERLCECIIASFLLSPFERCNIPLYITNESAFLLVCLFAVAHEQIGIHSEIFCCNHLKQIRATIGSN